MYVWVNRDFLEENRNILKLSANRADTCSKFNQNESESDEVGHKKLC